jgi:phospho-N-acetylmuramoyl-pentapeptide-transferase
MQLLDIITVFTPAALAFFIGIAITPLISHTLYSRKLWKKRAGKVDLAGQETHVFNELHQERETGTPRMGGIVIWLSVLCTVGITWFAARIFTASALEQLDFLSRSQTWLPLFTLLAGALVGLVDDVLEVSGAALQHITPRLAGGLSLRYRLGIVAVLGLGAALWFYIKLDTATVGMPFLGDVFIGWYFIPYFILVTVALYAGGVIDGIDGLSGGVFASIFAAYAGIAFYQEQLDLAAFAATVVGAILAFLWFNIPPARFYMSETGTMGLTVTLAIVAFMTDSLGGGYGVFVLPIVAFPLVLTVLSNVVQVASKKLRGRKVFAVAPLHHHFEALGWPPYKVTMRYWVISIVFAIIGLSLALVG